ncbi:MAG: peptide chain release factor N(5)-glutamine methyltransferase [Lachnospiraceae bacterium]|nr:peptide chain release factor N(5)-glutamine methyltransferase [Lachnospiraceae bacterium]
MTLENCLRQGINTLQSNNVSDADFDAFALLEYVTGVSKSDFFFKKSDEISDSCYDRYIELIERRSKRVPLQHITNRQNFFGYDFYVDSNVLIPRQDTEVLIEKILEVIEANFNVEISSDISILDMCTGSGCIAITIYKELIKRGFNIDATAVDLSKEALAVTEKNVENLVGIKALNNTFHIIESDMFSNINNNRSYDIIVSNPPYIPTRDIEKLEPEVRDYDPIMALDGDTDGLRFYRRIIEESSNYLNNNGFIAFEIGYNQGDDVKSLLEEKGYKDIHIYKDLGGLDRVIIGRNN